MNRRLCLWCVIALIAAGALVGAAESLRIVPIVRDDTVLISFELADAYTDAVREAVSSGLRTTFTYDIALRMHVPVWVDRTIATAVVSMTDHFDNLTRRHSLSRTVDGRLLEVTVTADEAVARRWLTAVNPLPVCGSGKLGPGCGDFLQVSARGNPKRA